MLIVDSMHQLGKYGETFLAANVKDGNDGIFHITFSIIDNEVENNWTWIMEMLKAT